MSAQDNPLAAAFAKYVILPDEAPYLDKIAARYSRTDENGCVFVHGGRHSNGRPQIGVGYEKWRIARFIVSVRDDLDMRGDWDTRHTCNVRACVNPDHLVSGSRQENALDRYEQGTAPIGERAPNVKLTEDKVREIHRLAGTMTQAQIAEQFGVSRPAVSRIINGHTWQHVFDEAHNAT